MYREAINELKEWKNNKNRKPLIIRGARQVGKTWIMREFARTCYEKSVYVNFDNNPQMKALFSSDMKIDRIVTGLEIYAGRKIDAKNTLLIFDEIQESPEALASLKYFNEDAPLFDIVCAGSLLGVALHRGTSFPVGKVEFLDLFPMSFTEFLRAAGKENLAELLISQDFEMAMTFRQDYEEFLKYYYYVGGMPEAVGVFRQSFNFNAARAVQQRILDAYQQDFSKHAPFEIVPRLRMLWNSIPSQLSKENKKFIYGLVRDGARAKDYEAAVLWLADCGLIHKIHRISAPSLPLAAYQDLKSFKLFAVDIGLLCCMSNLGQSILLDGSALFKEFKGALTEQYVLQQLKTLKNIDVYYWTNDRNSAEIDFVIDTANDAIPIEVKAETNLNAKSLKVYCEKFKPRTAIRTSMAGYKREGHLINIPLWAIINCLGKGADSFDSALR